jgi:hypothetical protein
MLTMMWSPAEQGRRRQSRSAKLAVEEMEKIITPSPTIPLSFPHNPGVVSHVSFPHNPDLMSQLEPPDPCSSSSGPVHPPQPCIPSGGLFHPPNPCVPNSGPS